MLDFWTDDLEDVFAGFNLLLRLLYIVVKEVLIVVIVVAHALEIKQFLLYRCVVDRTADLLFGEIFLLATQVEVLIHDIHKVNEPFYKDIQGGVGQIIGNALDTVHVISQSC